MHSNPLTLGLPLHDELKNMERRPRPTKTTPRSSPRNAGISQSYLERGSTKHPPSGNGKSHACPMVARCLMPMVFLMKTSAFPTLRAEVQPYVELQQQIHEALRRQHPEWVQPNGESPICDAYESRFAELLGVPSPERAARACLILV